MQSLSLVGLPVDVLAIVCEYCSYPILSMTCKRMYALRNATWFGPRILTERTAIKTISHAGQSLGWVFFNFVLSLRRGGLKKSFSKYLVCRLAWAIAVAGRFGMIAKSMFDPLRVTDPEFAMQLAIAVACGACKSDQLDMLRVYHKPMSHTRAKPELCEAAYHKAPQCFAWAYDRHYSLENSTKPRSVLCWAYAMLGMNLGVVLQMLKDDEALFSSLKRPVSELVNGGGDHIGKVKTKRTHHCVRLVGLFLGCIVKCMEHQPNALSVLDIVVTEVFADPAPTITPSGLTDYRLEEICYAIEVGLRPSYSDARVLAVLIDNVRILSGGAINNSLHPVCKLHVTVAKTGCVAMAKLLSTLLPDEASCGLTTSVIGTAIIHGRLAYLEWRVERDGVEIVAPTVCAAMAIKEVPTKATTRTLAWVKRLTEAHNRLIEQQRAVMK